MNFNQQYHPKSFLPKLVAGKLLYNLAAFPYKQNDLLVLNYHSTPEWLLPEFEKQLLFFSKHFHFITAADLNPYFRGETNITNPGNKPGLLFTFDDGLKNNMHAAILLEKYGTRGLFFLVPDFLNAAGSLQKSYYMQHIRKEVNFNIDTTPSDVTAMSVDDIRLLISNGHSIGSHSLTHTMKSNDDETKQLNEIVQSKHELELISGGPVTSFCAPFDSLRSTSKKQMDLIKQHYLFYHSTFPGSNENSRNPFFIKRVNVECWWPLDVIKFAISRLEWSRWRPKREQFTKEILNS